MTDIIQELKTWFKDRPNWLQYAAKKMAENFELDEKEIQKCIIICKNEAGIKTEIIENFNRIEFPAEHFFNHQNNTNTIKLISLSKIKGINALSPRKPLEFGRTNLSIIYGRNGTGKSGYVRLLKHICGAKNPRHLYSNVYKNEKIEQSCEINYSVDGEATNIIWKPQDGHQKDILPIKLYDTDCALVYVDNENEITVEPKLLRFFTDLTELCQKIDNSLQLEINSKVSQKPTLPIELLKTPLGEWYNNLDHNVTINEVYQKCKWTQKEDDEFNKIKTRLAESNPAEKAKEIRKIQSNIKNLKSLLENIHSSLSVQKSKEIFESKKDAQLKRKATDIDVKKVFENAPLSGVGSKTWKLLWEAARQFSINEAYKDIKFPNIDENAKCVLCQQLLDSETKVRMKGFENYIKGSLEKAASDAENKLKNLIDQLPNILSDEELSIRFDSSNIKKNEQRQKVLDFCNTLEKRKISIISSDDENNVGTLPSITSLDFMDLYISELEKTAKLYDEDSKEDNRDNLEKQEKQYKSQKWLFDQIENIKSEIERLQKIHLLQNARKLTNTQALSLKKSILSQRLITDEYKGRFISELHNLGASSLKVDLLKTRANKGHVFHKLILKECKTSVRTTEILSEGEFRIISLVVFLADILDNNDNSPIIFDDPISSLDQDFEELTVKRLVSLCSSRQIIVFTHRLSMLFLLQHEAEKQGYDTNVVSLEYEPWGAGEPYEPPLPAQKPKSALNTLRDKSLSEAKITLLNDGATKYDNNAKSICRDIRITIERLIENDLLADIIQRFRRDIKTKGKLHNLAKIRLDDCCLLEDFMEKYSRYEHSQPNEAPIRLPEPDEIIRDLEKLIEWRKEFEERK